MSRWIAALPMYDWPERRGEVDAEWAALRARLLARGIDAPARLARCNADLPPVPGGIRDASGRGIAPDPATLPPDELDLRALWLHPCLLFAQACWGPLELGLADRVRILGQPDYSGIEGGDGAFYSSAILVRSDDVMSSGPATGIPVSLLRGRRLAFNSADSMSGLLALSRDLEAMGEGPGIFSQHIETGGHRRSIVAVAEGRADVAAVDCRSWALARHFEPRAAALRVAGWTGRRKGLPYIAGLDAPLTAMP